MSCKKSAFTLIELLITITIIGLLSAISVAAFNNYMAKAHLTNARIFAKHLKDTALRQKTIEEKNIFTAWYSFDGENDVNQSRPFIIDNSENKNNITSSYCPKCFTVSQDTPYNIGKSLKVEHKKDHALALNVPNKNRSDDRFTIAYWIKSDKLKNYRYGAIKNSTYVGHIYISKNGNLRTWNGGSNIGYGNYIKLNKNFTFNQWHYLVKSVAPNGVKVWIDGDLVLNTKFTSPQTLPYGHGAVYLYFGQKGTLGYSFLLDDVMFIPYAFDGEKFY